MQDKIILKYHNDINKLKLGIFTEKETDIFFTLLLKAKEQNNFNITFQELKKITDYKATTKKRFVDNILSLASKLKALNQTIEIKQGEWVTFSLFRDIVTSTNRDDITLEVDERFRYLIKDLINNFTMVDLKELVSLNSSYSKIVYRVLKQWSSTRERIFSIEEFRELLGIPIGYRMSEIDKFVLEPVLRELPSYFTNLKLEKLKNGRAIAFLKFTWKSGKENCELLETNLIEISKELSDTIKETRSNSHIVKFLSDGNIDRLLTQFEEKELMKGLKYARKNIKVEFKQLTYLINSIKKGIETTETKLIVKQQELFEEKKEVIETCGISVTQEEYEKMYSEYLKKNDLKNNKISKITFQKMSEKKIKIIDIKE